VPGTLKSGDYSLLGFENRIAIERKSLSDLFSTLGQGRDRFHRELERLAATDYQFAAVVCEADWATVLASPPERSMLRPKTVFRSVIAWQIRYPLVHWWFCPGRAFAEKVTFRLLERFWKEQQTGNR
ncbi:MAG: ERCC4 domain-containing protein, partial [Patescibacteria group bacterium]|nr:ERCC4 domain-containing protein [Patescibacteria group bacterium]